MKAVGLRWEKQTSQLSMIEFFTTGQLAWLGATDSPACVYHPSFVPFLFLHEIVRWQPVNVALDDESGLNDDPPPKGCEFHGHWKCSF
jgi:hypothetical protein